MRTFIEACTMTALCVMLIIGIWLIAGIVTVGTDLVRVVCKQFKAVLNRLKGLVKFDNRHEFHPTDNQM